MKKHDGLVIHLVAAARPNFMKVAPLYHALAAESWCRARIVHTGQHYDANMSDAFFSDLRLPEPSYSLGVGSGTHAEQTGGVMIAYERVVNLERPDWIVVVGDVNSTLACALVAAKQGVPVIHLEAGLRSGDRRMPEEINRIATDAICDVLWTPSPDADENLEREGVARDKIDRVGNIMIDSFEMMRPAIAADRTVHKLGLSGIPFGVITLHRPSNVDSRVTLRDLVESMVSVSTRVPLVFAVHPRTQRKLAEFGLLDEIAKANRAADGYAKDRRIVLVEPLGYVQFMNLVQSAAMVITDSGGVQEESTYLGVPCLTLRENTERPVTITHGTNQLVQPGQMLACVDAILAGAWRRGQRPELWDGAAAGRCVESLRRRTTSEGGR